jgi:hypothetical protein
MKNLLTNEADERLPDNWEARITDEGRVYFVRYKTQLKNLVEILSNCLNFICIQVMRIRPHNGSTPKQIKKST